MCYTNMRTLRRVTERIPLRPRIPLPVLPASAPCAPTKYQDVASGSDAEASQAISALSKSTDQSNTSLALAQVSSPRLSSSPEPLVLESCSGQITKRTRPVLSRINTCLPLSRSSTSLLDYHFSFSEFNALSILTHTLENVLPPAQSATCPSLAVSLSSLPSTPGPITPVRGNSIIPTKACEADLKAQGFVKQSGLPSGAESSVGLPLRNLSCEEVL